VSPTGASRLVAAAVVALLGTGLLLRAAGPDSLPALPLPAVVVIGVVALVDALLARSVRARVRGSPGTRPILPITVARTAALAQASSLTGALAAGAWLALLADRLRRLGEADAVVVDGLVAGAGLVGALLLVAAALRLEGVCRVRRPPPRPGD